MARVTVEDCLHGVENLFQLVLVASRRARQIYAGSDIRVDEDGDKPTVIALREVADGLTGPEVLDQKIIPGLEAEAGEPEQLDSEMPSPPVES